MILIRIFYSERNEYETSCLFSGEQSQQSRKARWILVNEWEARGNDERKKKEQ